MKSLGESLTQLHEVLGSTAFWGIEAYRFAGGERFSEPDVASNGIQYSVGPELVTHFARDSTMLTDILGSHGRQKTKYLQTTVVACHDLEQHSYQLSYPFIGQEVRHIRDEYSSRGHEAIEQQGVERRWRIDDDEVETSLEPFGNNGIAQPLFVTHSAAVIEERIGWCEPQILYRCGLNGISQGGRWI